MGSSISRTGQQGGDCWLHHHHLTSESPHLNTGPRDTANGSILWGLGRPRGYFPGSSDQKNTEGNRLPGPRGFPWWVNSPQRSLGMGSLDLTPSQWGPCGGLALSQGRAAQNIRATLWASPDLEDTDTVLQPRPPA